MATKTCSKCGEEKDVGEFGRRTAAKDGLQYNCKLCRHSYDRERHASVSEKSKARRKEINRRYERKNRQKRLEKARRWRSQNPDYFRNYAVQQREHHRKMVRRWREKNPDKDRATANRRRARKLAAIQGNPTALAARLKEIYASPCARCGTTENIHADHVIPLSKGGHHAPYNLQPLCGSCNSVKGSGLTPLLPMLT